MAFDKNEFLSDNLLIEETFKRMGIRNKKNSALHILKENVFESNLINDVSDVDLKEKNNILKMDYYFEDHNLPSFSCKDLQNQIFLNGEKVWNSLEEIAKNHSFLSIEGKAKVIGHIPKDRAKEIYNIPYILFVVTLGYSYFIILQNGIFVF